MSNTLKHLIGGAARYLAEVYDGVKTFLVGIQVTKHYWQKANSGEHPANTTYTDGWYLDLNLQLEPGKPLAEHPAVVRTAQDYTYGERNRVSLAHKSGKFLPWDQVEGSNSGAVGRVYLDADDHLELVPWEREKPFEEGDDIVGSRSGARGRIVRLERLNPGAAGRVDRRFRGHLHNDLERCIGCKNCQKACPVDCFWIDTEETTTADKRIARFDIDLSRCIYCGLCVRACPTGCLVFTNDWWGSSFADTPAGAEARGTLGEFRNLHGLLRSFGEGYFSPQEKAQVLFEREQARKKKEEGRKRKAAAPKSGEKETAPEGKDNP